ncbi:MAG: nitroreductase family protein [Clostridia bacterium]|nr:nitroreductase family protein [Clostridia bacterium]
MNGILDLIKTRQSCRSYSGRDVEREKLQKILEAGRLSPSARNSQPWYLTLAVSAEKVAAVGECTRAGGKNAFTDKCSAFIVVSEQECEAAFGGKPHRYYAEMDIGMCVMNICLQAQSLGVSSCIIGAFDEEMLKKVAGIDDDKNIKLVIALGYASDGYPVREKTRKSFEEAVKII